MKSFQQVWLSFVCTEELLRRINMFPSMTSLHMGEGTRCFSLIYFFFVPLLSKLVHLCLERMNSLTWQMKIPLLLNVWRDVTSKTPDGTLTLFKSFLVTKHSLPEAFDFRCFGTIRKSIKTVGQKTSAHTTARCVFGFIVGNVCGNIITHNVDFNDR